jgi:radical SAM superfamily enzyme YgiQ (UPF0313 family)
MNKVTLCSATLGEDGKTEPPLGPLYVAAALEQVGVTVDFRDYQLGSDADAFDPQTLVRHLEGHEQYVLLSCFVDMLPVVIAAAQLLVAARPDTIVILGGPGPSGNATELLRTYPWIGGIVRGEGEETVQAWALAQRRSPSGPIAGMTYRHGDELIEGPARPRVTHVDKLPLPAYHLVRWNRYSNARIITTRGCPYHCSFCDVAALWNYQSTFRALDRTIDEMDYLRRAHGKSSIAIVDDTFVLNRERVKKFCRLLLASGSNFEWGCFGRINLMTPELIELMARAGCRAVFYGIDSGSPSVLKETIKSVKAETILPVLKLSAQYFDQIEASFIWGYPFETLQDFQLTLELAGEASLLAPRVNVQLHMLSPLPNSPIYRAFAGKLLKPEPEDARWLLLPNLLLDERAREIRAMVERAPSLFPGFYTFPTPDKQAKRELLQRSMRALDRTIGMTIFDDGIGALLEEENGFLEQELLHNKSDPSDRIGVGLALGFFRRTRRRHAYRKADAFDSYRGLSLVRERNDSLSCGNIL